MIPEPFTYVAAGFGIVMILINTAASTLEASKQRLDTFREYGARLKRISSDIQLCEFEFADCLADWRDEGEGNLLCQEDCIELFGEKRYQYLKNQIVEVVFALAKLQQILFHGFERIDHERQRSDEEGVIDEDDQPKAGEAYRDAWAWMDSADREQIFASSKTRNWKLQARRVFSKFQILVRVKYTLWEGDAIDRRTQELQASISKLQRFTKTLSKHVPGLDSSDSSFADRVRQLVQLNRRWQHFSTIMGTISERPFAIIPRQPDDEGHMNCLREGEDVTTCMLVEVQEGIDVAPSRKVVYVAFSTAKSLRQEELVENALLGQCRGFASNVEVPCPTSKGKNLRELYKCAAGQSLDIQSKLQRLWEEERVDTALALVTWTLLLWKTPWSRCICTARLWRYPPVKDNIRLSMVPCATECLETHNSFKAMQSQASAVQHQDGHVLRESYFRRTPTTEEVRKAKQTLMSLAVTLCEIALICPIEVIDCQVDSLAFSLGGAKLSEHAVLRLVERMMTQSYRKVVEVCFHYAKASICCMAAASDVFSFWDKVFVPLEKWKTEVVDGRNGAGSKGHWRTYTQIPEKVAEVVVL